MVEDIYGTAMTGPSGFCLQPAQVIMVTCPYKKDELVNHAMLGFGNVHHTKDATFLSNTQWYNGQLQRILSLDGSSRDVNYQAM